MSLRDEIEAAKAEIEAAEPTTVDVEFKGKLKTVAIRPLLGGDWDLLTEAHPPRESSARDADTGYNVDAVSAAYPAEKITVDGEAPDAETWADFVHTLSSPNRQNIAAVIWGINKFEQQQVLIELGKAKRA